MSKAPPVSRDISCANVNTSVNILSAVTSSLRLIFAMTDCLLNGDNELSTFFSSASMPAFMFLSLW